MWMTIIGFLGGPVIKGLIDSYKLHLEANTNDKKIAQDLAGKEIAAQVSENDGIFKLRMAQIGHPWEPEKLAMYITLFYYGKLLIYDKCLGLGSTDPLTGYAAIWAGMIMSFYFAKRGAENVTTIIKAFR